MTESNGSGLQPSALRRVREVQLRQLRFRRQTLGEDHPQTLEAMDQLAQTLSALGDHERSRQLCEQALRRQVRLLGERAPQTVRCAWTLMRALLALGDRAAMRVVFGQHLAWLCEVTEDEVDRELRRIQTWVAKLASELPAGSEGEAD